MRSVGSWIRRWTVNEVIAPNLNAQPQVKVGGKATLDVLVQASNDILDCLVSLDEGGLKLERGLVARVHECTQGSTTVRLRHASADTSERLLVEVRADPALLTDADIVVLSVASDVTPNGTGEEAARRFEESMEELTRLAKDRGAHVIVFNASSFDPTDTTSCYSGVDDTPALFVQHLNCALIRLSMLDGISIIDTDRIISEIGGRSHVEKLLSYSPHACDLLCRELVRVLDDYGFFQDRPLLAQVGRRNR